MTATGALPTPVALVVDDDPDTLELLVGLVASAGLGVRVARSGNEAFARFLHRPADLLLSDLEMPDGSGLKLIRRIRRLAAAHGGRIPAIAISGTATPELAMEAGFHACFEKPFSPTALLDTVQALLREPPGAPVARNGA